MGRLGQIAARRVAACVVAAGMAGGGAAAFASDPDRPLAQGASAEAHEALKRALVDGDANGRPFAIVDKKQARLLVFRANGELAGSAPALLGLARGDYAVAGLGRRPPGQIAPHERTTPAGRFESQPGLNHRGEAIVWIDYDAALAIHRLRPAPAGERRPQRLATPSPDDNRISLGCIVVDAAFYDAVVAPTLGRQRGVVYVLPESGPGTPWAPGATAMAPRGAGPLPQPAAPAQPPI